MATTYTVTKVGKELPQTRATSTSRACATTDGTHYARQQVVDSIDAGNTGKTRAGG